MLPALGPLSRVVVLLVVAAIGAAGAAGLFVVFTKLDYQALNLGSLFAPALLPVVAIALALVGYGPLAGVRERIPARGAHRRRRRGDRARAARARPARPRRTPTQRRDHRALVHRRRG